MKVLFAVSNDNITKGVISKYQRMYKEIITSKNVYYFNAIVNELQRDKSYDAIIVSEDLEPISNNNFEAVDNFLVEKLDNISDEASKPTGEDIPIIFICSDRRTKTDVLLRKFFSMSIYNALVGNDRNLDQLCSLLNKPRNKKEAKKYYNIDNDDEIEYKPSSNDLVSEDQIRNILNYYGRIGNNEKKCVEAFNSIANQYDDTQLRIIVKFLPMPVKAILETSCQKYQELMSNGTVLSNGKYVKYKNNETEKQKKHGFLDFMEKDISKEKMDKPVIIPSVMNIGRPIQESGNSMNMAQGLIQPKPMQSVQSMQNVQPTQQVQPMQNVQPVQPIQPISNVQPTQPMQQVEQQPKPVQPINHVEPVKPVESIPQQSIYNEPDMQQSPYLGEQQYNQQPGSFYQQLPGYMQNNNAGNNNVVEEKKEDTTPSATNTQDIQNDVAEPEVTEQKRGRGRPRKYPVSTEPKVKKKRGRPRKNPLPEETETNEQSMQKEQSVAPMVSNGVQGVAPVVPNAVQSVNTNIAPSANESQNTNTIPSADVVQNTNQSTNENKVNNVSLNVNNNVANNSNANTTNANLAKNNSEDKNAQKGEKNNMFDDQETNLFDMNLGTNNNQNYQGNVNPMYNQNRAGNVNQMYNQNQANNFGYNNNMNYNFDNNFNQNNSGMDNQYMNNQNVPGMDNQYMNNQNSSSMEMNNPYDQFNNFNANSNQFGGYGDMGMNQPNMNFNENQFNNGMINTNQNMNQPMNNVAKKGKIALFVGTTKNGTSFIVNNLAQMLSENNIKTAIVDLTRNKNAYYMFTNNDPTKMKIAGESLKNLSKGVISGIEYNKNLTIFTELPGETELEPIDENAVIANVESNFDVVLLDCDFTTKQKYFALANEIYLVQTMDAFTIQPLTKFLSDLKANNLLDETKLRVVINKYVKLKMLDYKMIIGGMSKYNEPSMTLQRDLFNANAIKYVLVPFEENAYEKYLEEIAMCQLSLEGFSKELVEAFTKLKEIVYPLVAGDDSQGNNGGYTDFNNYNNNPYNQNMNQFGANQYGSTNSYGNNNYYGNMGQTVPQYGQYNSNQFSNSPVAPNATQEKKKKRGLFGRKKEEEIPNNNPQMNQTFSNNMNDTLNKMRNNY